MYSDLKEQHDQLMERINVQKHLLHTYRQTFEKLEKDLEGSYADCTLLAGILAQRLGCPIKLGYKVLCPFGELGTQPEVCSDTLKQTCWESLKSA